MKPFLTLILFIVQIGFLMVVVSGLELEWKGQVKVEESLIIPSGGSLVIREGSVVSFAPVNNKKISILVQGKLLIESDVELKSIDSTLLPNSTDQWGFVFPAGTQQASLALTNLKVKKNILLSEGMATFSFETGSNETVIDMNNCEFDGGFISVYIASNTPLSCQSSSFSNMVSAVQTEKSSFPKMTFSDSKFTNMGIAIDDKGSSLSVELVYRTITIADCKFKSISRAVSASCKVVVTSTVFQEFRGAITAPFIHCQNSIFDNRQHIVSALGIYISNIPQGYKGEVFVKESTFSEITGSVYGSQGDVIDFTFVNNVIRNCATSAGLKTRHSLLEMAGLTGTISITKNEFIGNQILTGENSILSIHRVQSLAYITNNNFHDNNVNSCVIKMSDALDTSVVFTFSQNILTNYAGSKTEPTIEFCFQGTTTKKMNIAYNYWGTDASKMNPTQMSNMIVSKIKPVTSLEFNPYYLSSNVNDQSASNLGGLDKPTKPKSSLIATIVGGIFGGASALLFVTMVVMIIIIFVRRKKRAYKALI